MNEYSNINNFAKTPRNIPKENVKFFFKTDGNLGKNLVICLMIGIVLSILTLILCLFSMIPLWVPIAFGVFSAISYFFLRLLDPKLDKLNNYPLAMGYVLLANNSLYLGGSDRQGGSLIIFTKEDNLRLNSEFITNIGEKIKNHEVEDLDNLYSGLDDFGNGKSVFGIDIPNPIEGVKIYCSYVILDGRNLPDGRIPESRLIPCLIDENNRGIAVPYHLIK